MEGSKTFSLRLKANRCGTIKGDQVATLEQSDVIPTPSAKSAKKKSRASSEIDPPFTA